MAVRKTIDLIAQRIFAKRISVKFGVRRRSFTVPLTKADIASGGTLAGAYITLPKKAWIKGVGFQSAGSDVVLATGDSIYAVTDAGTILASFVAGSDSTIGSGRATLRATHNVGTFVATNKPILIRVSGTDTGVSGSVFYFVDYEPSDEVGRG